MKYISFRLTMPNKGSWNGKWSGEDKLYYIIYRVDEKTFIRKYQELFGNNTNRSWHYSWKDGWGANVTMELISDKEAKHRKKVSRGFCRYDWMVDSILKVGYITTDTELKELSEQQ